MELPVEVLWIVLRYFGWEEYEIEELLGTQRTRSGRKSFVRRIGSGMTSFKTKRSIIREIGSRLPLSPCRRPCFQLTFDSRPHAIFQKADIPEEKPWSHFIMATLADIGQMGVQNEPNLKETKEQVTSEEDLKRKEEIETRAVVTLSDASAIAKISALEDELQKLREQIATLVTAPQQPPAAPLTPSIPTGVAPPAPPPPPPPPPPPSTSTPIKAVSQIIKENRARNRRSGVPGFEKPESVPDMADILKGLGTVKLKSVERSPGGTPLRKKPRPTEGTDPASIIAQALKKKFAHRRFQCAGSPDSNKENSPNYSPTSRFSPSPQRPVPFGPHLLKSNKFRRRSSNGTERKPSTSPLVQIVC